MSEYFRAHFIQVHRRKDVSHRPLYLVRPPVRHRCCVALAVAVAVAAAAVAGLSSTLPLPPRMLDFILLLPLLPSSQFVNHHLPPLPPFLFPLHVSCLRHAAATLADPTLLPPSPQHFTSMLVRISSIHLSRPPVMCMSGERSQARRALTHFLRLSTLTMCASSCRVVSVIAGHQGDTVDHHQRCVTAHPNLLRCVTPSSHPFYYPYPYASASLGAFSASSPAVIIILSSVVSCFLHLHGVPGR